MKEPRYLAVELLNKTFKNNGYSNIQLNYGLEKSEMNDMDKRLCSVIYYGVIERRITLDYILKQHCSRPLEKLDLTVLNILRCGIYQLLYMENVPDNAAVNESVSLAKKLRKASASGMVNAVLRNFIRAGKTYPKPKDILISSSVEYSAPEWLIESLSADYGLNNMADLLSDSLKKPPVTIRLNTVKADEAEIVSQLGNLKYEKDIHLSACYGLECGDVTALPAFKNGFFHVQDKSSQLCCMALNHAQGVALAASRNGIKSLICLPDGAPISKIESTKSYGAEICLVKGVYDDAYAKALQLRDEKGYTFIHPFDDENVIAGQGTIGLELIEQLPDMDAVIVPIGGGGLISGVAFAIKSLNSNIKVYGVQASGAPSMLNSVRDKQIERLDSVSTIADGIAVKEPGENTFKYCSDYADSLDTGKEFEAPEGVTAAPMCSQTGKIASSSCPHGVMGYWKSSNAPVCTGGHYTPPAEPTTAANGENANSGNNNTENNGNNTQNNNAGENNQQQQQQQPQQQEPQQQQPADNGGGDAGQQPAA